MTSRRDRLTSSRESADEESKEKTFHTKAQRVLTLRGRMDDAFRGRAGQRRGRRWVTRRRPRMNTPFRPRWLWLEPAPRRPPAWPRPPPFRQRRSAGSLLQAGGERGEGRHSATRNDNLCNLPGNYCTVYA